MPRIRRSVRRVTTLGASLVLGALAACSSGSSTNPHPGSSLSLNVGQSANFLDSVPQNINLSVSGGAQYIIAVLNTSADRTVAENFDLVGSGGPHNVVSNRPPIAAARTALRTLGPPQRRIQMPSAEGAAVHMAMLDSDREIFRRIQANGGLAAIRARFRAAQQGRSRDALSARAMPGPPPGKIDTIVGHNSRLFIRTTLAGSCGKVDTVTARTVAVTSKLIVLEDNASATAGTIDAFYTALANEYDAKTYPEVLQNFGDPLLIDSVVGDSLAHLHRVAALFSPVLNTTLHGVAGFVNPCDFLPNGFVFTSPVDTVRSNDTEIFYGFVPDNVSANGFKTAQWEPFIRSVSAHETKHVASFAAHINNPAVKSFETSWLEEATAQASAEIWSRNFLAATWKGNATYNQTVGCELGQSCPGYTGPVTYSDSHLVFLYFFMDSLTNESVLGPATVAKYGGSWMFARWTADQFATDEAAYFKSIIDATDTGLVNLSARTGRPANELMLDYYLALASNNITSGFVPTDPRLTEPSYNLRNIFLGISQLGDPNFTLAYPLVPLPVSSGSFDSPVVGLRGGGAAVFLLSTSGTGTQAISVKENGVPISAGSSGLRFGIVRVQ